MDGQADRWASGVGAGGWVGAGGQAGSYCYWSLMITANVQVQECSYIEEANIDGMVSKKCPPIHVLGESKWVETKLSIGTVCISNKVLSWVAFVTFAYITHCWGSVTICWVTWWWNDPHT